MKFVFFFLTVFSLNLNAQESTVNIYDFNSKLPVKQANICIESLNKKSKNFLMFDVNGYVSFYIQGRTIIAISALGYQTIIDTINPGEKKHIFMHPSVYDLSEVVVTGQHKASKVDNSIYRIEVINSAQIRERAASNLAELLSTELKLRLTQDGLLGSNISLQGLSGEHIKILVDGVPVIGRQGGIIDLSQVLLSNVDRIEIVEGPMSVIYGSNALAGAINIITKQPKYGKFISKVDVNYETVGIYNAEAHLTIINKKNRFSFNGGRNFFDGYSYSDTSRVKDWKPKEQYFSGLDYVYKGKCFNTKVSVNYFREKLLSKGVFESSYLPDTLRDMAGGIDTVRYFITFKASDQYHYTKRFNVKGEFEYTFSENSGLMSILSYSTYNKIKNTYIKDFADLSETLAANSAQDTTKMQSVLFRAVYNNTTIEWLHLMGGADLDVETAKGKRISGKQQIEDYAVYSNIKFFPKSKLNFQVGSRIIFNSMFEAPIIYSLNARYIAIDNLVLRASYGKGFRAPSLKELYLIFQDISHNIQGNDSLVAEKSKNYSVSIDYSILPNKNHFLKLNCNFFYNIINNKIDFLFDINNPTWAKYYNILSEHFVSKGAEISATYKFHPRFSFTSGVNFLARSKASDVTHFFNNTDYTIDFNYKNLKYLFRLSAYYKYTDTWYSSRAELDKSGESRVQDGYMKGYHSLNVIIGRPFFKNKLDITIGGKNLFGNTTVTSYGATANFHGSNSSGAPVGWGRSYYVRLTYNFIKH